MLSDTIIKTLAGKIGQYHLRYIFLALLCTCTNRNTLPTYTTAGRALQLAAENDLEIPSESQIFWVHSLVLFGDWKLLGSFDSGKCCIFRMCSDTRQVAYSGSHIRTKGVSNECYVPAHLMHLMMPSNMLPLLCTESHVWWPENPLFVPTENIMKNEPKNLRFTGYFQYILCCQFRGRACRVLCCRTCLSFIAVPALIT